MPYFNIYKYGDVYKIVWFNGENNEKKKKTDKKYLESISEGIREYNKGNVNFFFEQQLKKNVTKLENNIIRAKSKVVEYSLCNEWEYFVTLTLDKTKQDRYDLDKYIKDLGNWINNYNKKYNTKLKYILIPEKHKISKGWHLHGLFSGITSDSLEKNKNGYLDLPYYKNRFGWISLDKIRDKTACSFYITKYITKDMSDRINDIGGHLYYCSKGLNHKEIVVGSHIDIDEKYKRAFFRNEYCNILWCDEIPEIIKEKYNEFIDRLDE